MRIVTAAAALSLVLGSTTLAFAQSQPAPEPAPASSLGTTVPGALESKGPSVWGILPWSGIGIGARFMLPLPIKPVLTNTNLRDSFALEFGADYLHWSLGIGLPGYSDFSVNEIIPVVGVMWNIWINDQLAFYPKLELGWGFGWVTYPNGYTASTAYSGHRDFYFDGAAGALYKLRNGLTLRGELGYAGLKLGVGWLF
jgi:hypothetical protein